jgi:two-component system, LytTR family, response regulator
MADLRVVIADDEPLARQRIEDLLARERGIEVAGTASTGDEAIEIIRRTKPDLVFLDVQMPAKTGLEVVEAIGADAMPATIFVTAFDRFALKAFDVAAVDYLLKPFDDERFEQALKRARKSIDSKEVERMTRRLLQFLDQEKPKFLEQIAVESRGQVRVVPVADIDYITASGPYAELHAGDKTYAVRERMQTIEEQLDPNLFFRIHRSAIVRLDRIDTLLHRRGGDYGVRLKNGTKLDVSRARRDALQQLLGIK